MGKWDFKYTEITSRIINAAMRVHNALKNRHKEVIYQRALVVEFESEKINYKRELNIPIFYKNKQIGSQRLDFLINDVVCLEIKALPELEDVHYAQIFAYLESNNFEIGLLINFGETSLNVKRLTNKKHNPNLPILISCSTEIKN